MMIMSGVERVNAAYDKLGSFQRTAVGRDARIAGAKTGNIGEA